MQRCDGLLIDRLDRHRSDLVIASRFEQCFGVRTISLAATHVAMDIVPGQETNGVAERLELSGPVMGGATGLEENCRRRPLSEVRQKSSARQPPFFVDVTRPMRHRHLKHRLCEIDGDGRMLHLDSSLPWPREAVSTLAR
jgi:hypothetical protein